METENDKALTSFRDKFATSYGAGAIPWASILAALASLLGGCLTPTAANVKSQVARPLVHIRMRRQLLRSGVPASQCERVIAATLATVSAATDDEINGMVSAAQETE